MIVLFWLYVPDVQFIIRCYATGHLSDLSQQNVGSQMVPEEGNTEGAARELQ